MPIDKRMLASGIVMIAVGFSITIYFENSIPLGESGMTDEEITKLLTQQKENQDFKTLSGILIGIGFLLVLISFGARPKKSGGVKKTEKKPTTED